MKLIVDSNVCQGHGRCYGAAPQLVAADDEGYAVVPEGGVEIAEDQLALAEELVGNCPEQAISLLLG